MRKASLPTNRASGRSRTKVAKAASISRLVLALKIWICSPMARAAASTSLKVVSEFATLAGLTSTATRFDAGQVAARSGEAGHKPQPDRVFGRVEDDGDCRGCRLGRQRRRGTACRDD